MAWDAFQRDALAALGHVVYVQRPAAGLPDDPLLRALLHAAGRDASASDAREWMHTWPAVARLRGDPAAKRALWPQLRALRASGAQS